MLGLLENIDLLPYKINFNYIKNDVFHSLFGLGLYILMYGVLIYFINYFSKDFTNKTNPQIIYKETVLTENIEFKLEDLLEEINFKLYNFSNYEEILKERNTTIEDHFGLHMSIF